jgi:hypothetical protein
VRAGGGSKQDRIDHAQTMTNYYYDLATDFYEYGWCGAVVVRRPPGDCCGVSSTRFGRDAHCVCVCCCVAGRGQSFHFAPRFKLESFAESILRHEYFLASRLGVRAGERVLDVGCGVGGPLRNIARFTRARVTGINNNAYQVWRAAATQLPRCHCRLQCVSGRCHPVFPSQRSFAVSMLRMPRRRTVCHTTISRTITQLLTHTHVQVLSSQLSRRHRALVCVTPVHGSNPSSRR